MEFRAAQETGVYTAGSWGGAAMLGEPGTRNVYVYKGRPSREQLLPGLEENGHPRGRVVLRGVESSGLAGWRDLVEHLSHSVETPGRPHLRRKGHTLK